MAKYIGVITIALTLFAFVDCAMREDHQIRKLPKWGWLLAIVFLFPPFGPVFYLVAGRQGALQKRQKKNKPRIIPPDDNPDFLRDL